MRPTRLRSVATTSAAMLLFALLAVTTPLSLESENWPAFRGADALSTAEDDARPADHLEHDRQRRLEDADRRARLVITGDLGRPDLLDLGGERR